MVRVVVRVLLQVMLVIHPLMTVFSEKIVMKMVLPCQVREHGGRGGPLPLHGGEVQRRHHHWTLQSLYCTFTLNNGYIPNIL